MLLHLIQIIAILIHEKLNALKGYPHTAASLAKIVQACNLQAHPAKYGYLILLFALTSVRHLTDSGPGLLIPAFD